MEPDPPTDCFEFWVRFVFGALLGGLMSLFWFGPGLDSWGAPLLCAVLSGVLAGWFGDRFWYAFARWSWWL